MTRILVVEDHADLAFGLETALENEGFAVEVAADGSAGLDRAWTGGFDLIILDLMLPRLDGYRVLRALRGDGSEVPVLVLTARGEEANKVQAFTLGADDYVTKPFGTLELIARVHALLRRARRGEGPPLPAVERFGDIEVNPASRTVYRGGQLVALTPREFDLLLALLKRRGAVGLARGSAGRGVAVPAGDRVAHRGHSYGRAPAKARGRPGASAAFADGLESRIPIGTVGAGPCPARL